MGTNYWKKRHNRGARMEPSDEQPGDRGEANDEFKINLDTYWLDRIRSHHDRDDPGRSHAVYALW